MSNESRQNPLNAAAVEKGLIAVLIGLTIFYYLLGSFLMGNATIKSLTPFYVIAIACMHTVLGIFYFLRIPKNIYAYLLLIIALSFLAVLILVADMPGAKEVLLLRTACIVVAGALFLYQSIQNSREYKSFEMISFLLGIFMILITPAVYFLSDTYEGLGQIFHFGLAFIIATIIYNENLWDQYNEAQKKLLIFLLVMSIVNVIRLTSQYL